MIPRLFTRRALFATTATVGFAGLTASKFAFATSATSQAASASSSLSPKEFREYKLVEIRPYNKNTRLYRFEVPGQEELPVSSFLLAKANVDGKDVVRPYTPLSGNVSNDVELLIKSYPEGSLSKHFGHMKVGDTIEMKGPLVKFDYKPNWKKEIGMLAGGTGITPMLQVINKVTSNPDDKTKLSLVFCNLTEDDILLKAEIDKLAAEHPNLSVTYMVDKSITQGWKGPVGLINESMIKKTMPKPSPDSLVLVCGPPGFVKAVSGPKNPDYSQGEVAGMLKKLGYKSEHVFKY